MNLKKFGLISLIQMVFLLIVTSSQAYIGLCCAHCGGNMPLNLIGAGIPEPKEFRVKVSQMYMNMGSLRDGTSDINHTSLLGPPPMGKFLVVPTSMDMFMTMFGGAYSFTDNFAAMAMISYKRNHMDMQFGSIAQGMAANGEDGFSMFSEGIGDLKLVSKYRLYSDDHLAPTTQFSILAGLSVPTGSINEEFSRNPILAQNGTILPFKMQMGSGTVDPILGLTYQGSTDPFWYGTNVTYTGRWYDNSQGYQQGDEVKVDVYGMYQFHPKVVVQAQLNFHYEGRYSDEPDRGKIDGEGHVMGNPNNIFASPLFDPDNYGGTKLNVSAGVQFQPLPLHIMELVASKPVHQDLNGPQLQEDWRIMFSYYIEIPTKSSRRYVGDKPPTELGF
jgi:hypothetical protein